MPECPLITAMDLDAVFGPGRYWLPGVRRWLTAAEYEQERLRRMKPAPPAQRNTAANGCHTHQGRR